MKYIAVRLKRFADAEVAFGYNENHKNKRKLIVSRSEKRDPALRNFTEGLESNGLKFQVDGCFLYWFQIDDDNSLEYYSAMNEVECVFDCDWFAEFKKGIRYYQGARYVEECVALANAFPLKNQNRKIDYVIEKNKPVFREEAMQVRRPAYR